MRLPPCAVIQSPDKVETKNPVNIQRTETARDSSLAGRLLAVTSFRMTILFLIGIYPHRSFSTAAISASAMSRASAL